MPHKFCREHEWDKMRSQWPIFYHLFLEIFLCLKLYMYFFIWFPIYFAQIVYEHDWDKLGHSDLYFTFCSWKCVCVWSLVHSTWLCMYFFIIFPHKFAEIDCEHDWNKFGHSDLYFTLSTWKCVCVWSLKHDYACISLFYFPHKFGTD